uniref:Uncharacterized protein n=1 Tax=Chrysemys picta bellii TaxID=8478 RepID=A0A8C3F7T6_CHRPI
MALWVLYQRIMVLIGHYKAVLSGLCRASPHALNKGTPVGTWDYLPHSNLSSLRCFVLLDAPSPVLLPLCCGQSLVPLCLPGCGECCSDLNPDTSCWQKTQLISISLLPESHPQQDQQIHHFLWIISTFSEYTVVPDSALARIVAAAPRDKICLSGCGFSTCYGAAINTAKVKPGSTCAIFSLGGMGLFVVVGCKAAGAKELGATEWINPQDFKKPFQEVLFEMTSHGVDRGRQPMVRVMYNCHTVLQDETRNLTITYSKCVCSIVHCVRGFLFVFLGWKTKDSIPKSVSSYMEKKCNPDVLMTHTLPFDKINEGFELLRLAKR